MEKEVTNLKNYKIDNINEQRVWLLWYELRQNSD